MKRSPVLLAALFLGGAGCTTVLPIRPVPQPKPIACTMEAKQCPDGSYVSRSGPNCEFTPCPTPSSVPSPTPSPVGKSCSGPSDKSCGSGYVCFQDCGPPVARDTDPPPGYNCQTNEFASKPRMCPICLASNTMIATPNGDIRVTDLKIGMPVWSPDAQGKKISRRIIKVSKKPVPSTHKVIHLVLSDARETWVSPNHPLIDGRVVAFLHAGDLYDGARVISAELVPYWDAATYDLLSDGDTGAYWANGILFESTLRTTQNELVPGTKEAGG